MKKVTENIWVSGNYLLYYDTCYSAKPLYLLFQINKKSIEFLKDNSSKLWYFLSRNTEDIKKEAIDSIKQNKNLILASMEEKQLILPLDPKNHFSDNPVRFTSTRMLFGEGLVYFHTCRDTFAGVFRNTSKFYIANKPEILEKSVNFINEAERRLKIENKTTFQDTLQPDILKVHVSPFWLNHSIKRSLFTALLRCGVKYQDDFEYALFSSKYTNHNEEQLLKFFDGFTEIEEPSRFQDGDGWSRMANKIHLRKP